MTATSMPDVHRTRAAQERAMAGRAASPHAQRAHLNLAAMHERAAHRVWG